MTTKKTTMCCNPSVVVGAAVVVGASIVRGGLLLSMVVLGLVVGLVVLGEITKAGATGFSSGNALAHG